ncbi:MAG: hypothetical protein H6Q00_2435 [Holophagaceae bacterium]|nr:hypothetical protein [Holophagaceae bacterium]
MGAWGWFSKGEGAEARMRAIAPLSLAERGRRRGAAPGAPPADDTFIRVHLAHLWTVLLLRMVLVHGGV